MKQNIIIVFLVILTSFFTNNLQSQSLTACSSNTPINSVNRLVAVKFFNNELYLTEASPFGTPSGRFIRATLAGVQTTLFSGLDFPLAVERHPTTGMFYIGERGFASSTNNRIRVINPATSTQITSFTANNTGEWSDVLSIDNSGKLFVIVNTGVHITSSQTVTNTRIRVYDTNNGHAEIIMSGIPLKAPANAIRFISLDTHTDTNTGITHLVVSNFSNGNVHVFDIIGNNVVSERTFPTGITSASSITIDTNKNIHVVGFPDKIYSFCFNGKPLANITRTLLGSGFLGSMDISPTGTIYTPYATRDAVVENSVVFCQTFTPAPNVPTATLSGTSTVSLGNAITVPISFQNISPSAANPVTVTLVRQPSGQIFNVNLTTPPYQYIDNSITTAGNYTYAVLNATSGTQCFSQTGVFKAVVQASGCNLTTTVSQKQTLCSGTSAQLLATGGTTYLWTPATGLSATNIANPIANPSTTTTYNVKISNGACEKTETVIVEVLPKPTANFSTTIANSCAGASVSITNISTTGLSYLWNFGNGQTSTLQNPAPVNYSLSGTYTISLSVKNGATCETITTKQVTVAVNNSLTTTVSPKQTLCSGTSAQLLATGGTTYLWTPATGLSAANIANPRANPSTTTTYNVKISNGTCEKTETVIVEVLPKPTANFNTTIANSCAGASVSITNISTTGLSYLWNFGNGQTSTLQNPAPVNYSLSGTYTISLSVKNGATCETITTKQVTVSVNNSLATTISPKQTLCSGTSAQLLATGGTTYLWTPATGLSAANIANPMANPSTTTTYNVKISNGTCEKTETVTVEVVGVKANFELKTSSECGENGKLFFVNKSIDSKNYTWFLGNGKEITSANYEFEKSGEYEIILEFYNGSCRQRQIQKVKVETIKPTNIITPNGDGKNDRFIIDILNTGWQLEVYNRLGYEVFRSNNYQNNWGDNMESGTYYYSLTSPEGKICKGWVVLLK